MATNYAVAPGEYLKEWIEDSGSGMTQLELANRIGASRKLVNGILCGRDPITEETAIKLARVTGIPGDAWLRYEAKYRSDLARIRDEKSLAEHVDEISPALGKYLRSVGATTATRRTPGRLVSDFLTFVGYGTFDAYREGSERLCGGLAALRESGQPVDQPSLMAWIASGERSDQYFRSRSLRYNEKALRDLLPKLRERATRPDESMIDDLASILEEAGVVYQFVPAPDKFPLHGITRWTPWGVPIIQQTGRRKKDGFIVWTLFHELGHILNDGDRSISVELDSQKADKPSEKGANEFARRELFGPEGLGSFRGLTRKADIVRVARAVGVSPGVAVNEMHRKRMLNYGWCNDLLVDVKIPMAV